MEETNDIDSPANIAYTKESCSIIDEQSSEPVNDDTDALNMNHSSSSIKICSSSTSFASQHSISMKTCRSQTEEMSTVSSTNVEHGLKQTCTSSTSVASQRSNSIKTCDSGTEAMSAVSSTDSKHGLEQACASSTSVASQRSNSIKTCDSGTEAMSAVSSTDSKHGLEQTCASSTSVASQLSNSIKLCDSGTEAMSTVSSADSDEVPHVDSSAGGESPGEDTGSQHGISDHSIINHSDGKLACDVDDKTSSTSVVDNATMENKTEGDMENAAAGKCDVKSVIMLLKPKPQSEKDVRRDDNSARLMLGDLTLNEWKQNFCIREVEKKIEDFIYWRNLDNTGLVFVSGLLLLMNLQYFSLITIMSYLSLAALAVGMLNKAYRNTQRGSNPNLEITPVLSEENFRWATTILAYYMNDVILQMRRLYLADDILDSVKFGFVLWYLTYVGTWFDGMTVITVSFVTTFSVPMLYERNKTQIDRQLSVCCDKFVDLQEKARKLSQISFERISNQVSDVSPDKTE